MKLITRIFSALYHQPKIIRLNLAKKQQAQPISTKQPKLKLTQQLKRSDKEQQLSLKTLQESMSKQNNEATKQQHGLNHLIKIETRASSLYKLYKSQYWLFSTRNLISLLVKILQLRNINLKQSQETQKLDYLMNNICKKINKLSPQDMIRFLYSLKKVKILQSDLIRLKILIQPILQEFASRTDQTAMKKGNEFQSFYVISLDSNIKLLHSLYYLHSITGNQYQPLIVDLIKGSLQYFHRLVNGKQKSIHNIRAINWSFYISFVRLASTYQLPLQVVTSFVRSLNMHKKSYQGNYNYLFAVEDILHNSKIIQTQCRGSTIANYFQIYHIHLFIYELIEKPNQLIKMRPLHLISHIKSLTHFTEEEIIALKFQNLRTTTLERILLFTNKLYEKYFTLNYANQKEKANIEKWVLDGYQSSRQYLGSFILIYKELINEKIVKNASQYSKLLNLCLKYFDSLTFHTQTVILRIFLEESYQNCKPIIDAYFGRGLKENQSVAKVHKFKKGIEVDAYMQLFPYWSKINTITNVNLDLYEENCFLKVFFTRISYFPNIQIYAEYMSDRIVGQKQFLSILVNKYVKVSQSNRFLGKNYLQKSQSLEFKKEIQNISVLIQNQRSQRNKLSEFAQLKFNIRANMIRGLKNFKFIILLLENINQKIGRTQINIAQSTLFKQLSFHFNEQIKCLHFKQLFTKQIYDIAQQIYYYMQSKNGLQQNDEIFKISQYEYSQKRIRQQKDTKLGLHRFANLKI